MTRNTLSAIFLSMAFAAVPAAAQQALGIHADVISPQVNADRTVTFRIITPQMQTDSVEIVGDCFPGGVVKLSENKHKSAGHTWTYTTSPLESELYSYAFKVDGVRINDPSNVHRLRDIATVSDIFIVPGGRGDLYSVNNVPHGTLAKTWYYSPLLGMNRRLTVYTPAGYEADTSRRYPVLYLLHGMGGDENAWSELGRATQIRRGCRR